MLSVVRVARIRSTNFVRRLIKVGIVVGQGNPEEGVDWVNEVGNEIADVAMLPEANLVPAIPNGWEMAYVSRYSTGGFVCGLWNRADKGRPTVQGSGDQWFEAVDEAVRKVSEG